MNRPRSRGLALLVRPERAEASLWRAHAAAPDDETRRSLFDHYRPFARGIARKRQARQRLGADERGDAEQLAYEALLHAIARYDPARGVPFEAFARPRINGHISNGLAQLTEAAAQYRYRQRAERDRLRSLRAGMDGSDPLSALSELAATLALGLMLEEEHPFDLDSLPDPQPSAYESLAWHELSTRLAERLVGLPAQEAYVIVQHYRHGVSFQQIAAVLGLSKGRISQIHRAALLRLRGQLAQYR